MHLNKLEAASDAFDQSLKFNRSSPEAHFQKAIVLRNMKDYEGSVDEFDKAIEYLELENEEELKHHKILHAQS